MHLVENYLKYPIYFQHYSHVFSPYGRSSYFAECASVTLMENSLKRENSWILDRSVFVKLPLASSMTPYLYWSTQKRFESNVRKKNLQEIFKRLWTLFPNINSDFFLIEISWSILFSEANSTRTCHCGMDTGSRRTKTVDKSSPNEDQHPVICHFGDVSCLKRFTRMLVDINMGLSLWWEQCDESPWRPLRLCDRCVRRRYVSVLCYSIGSALLAMQGLNCIWGCYPHRMRILWWISLPCVSR